MCGIFGFVNRTPAASVMMPFLALEMLTRGRDSWGVTDGVHVIKKLGQVIDSWHLPSWGESLIFHTRAGSVGDKTITNQHPFIFPEIDEEDTPTGVKIVGVHNGGIINHKELNEKYKRNFSVDSMHAFAHIAEGWDVKELRGAGAFVWFRVEEGKTPELHFARSNMQSFSIFRLNKKSLVFCSTAGPVVAVSKLFGWHCEELPYKFDSEYVVNPADPEHDGQPTIERVGEFELSTKWVSPSEKKGAASPGYYPAHRGGWGHYAETLCPSCHFDEDFCQCSPEEKISAHTPAVADATALWSIVTRTAVEQADFVVKVPDNLKGKCDKCSVENAVRRGTEMYCPNCLLTLTKLFYTAGRSYVYRW